MPSRRCPHCRVVSRYSPVSATGVPFRKEGQRLRHIRLERCDNEECGCSSTVVYADESCAKEIDIFPRLDEATDDEVPDGVKRAFDQALRSLNEGICDGCVLISRRALQEAMTDLGAKGKTLNDQINALAEDHRITADLADWAHEGRLAGNLGAHGDEAEKKWNNRSDAQEIIEFSRWFFRYAYVLPKQLAQRKQRLEEEAEAIRTGTEAWRKEQGERSDESG